MTGALAAAMALGAGIVGLSADAARATGAAPTQRVIVVLSNQGSGSAAGPAALQARAQTFATAQAPVLAQLRASGAGDVQAYSLFDAVSATVTSAEASALAGQPGVSSVVPDQRVQLPAATAGDLNAALDAAARPQDARGAAARSARRVGVRGALSPDVAPGGKGGASSSVCSSTPVLAPGGLPLIHAASDNPSAKTAASLGVTGAGVKVAFMADGLNIDNPDFIRPDGKSVFAQYKDFTGEGVNVATGGGEAFGDAASIAGQGTEYNVAGFSSTSPAGPCNVKIEGVAPGASLYGLDIYGGVDGAYDSVLLNAINYAVTVDHVNVIYEAFAGSQFPDDQGSQDVIKLANDAAVAAGVTITDASNDAGPSNTVGTPTSDPNVIAVGASTSYRDVIQSGTAGATFPGVTGYEDDNISPFSSGGFEQSGRVIDVVAPGELGWAPCTPNPKRYTECTNELGQPSNIELFGGTSEAAPLTAGVVALVDQAYKATHGTYPTPAVVKQIVTGTADDIDSPSENQGAGLVDAYHAVLAARSYRSPGATPTPVGTSVLAATSQLDAIDQPNTPEQLSDTLTNEGSVTEQLSLTSRTLSSWQTIAAQNVNISDSSSPQLPGWYGYPNYGTPVTFNVATGQARLQASVAWPVPPGGAYYQAVQIALVDPSGRLAEYSEPQGDGGYGNVQVSDPQPGKWTAYVFAITGALGGFQGQVAFSAQTATWTTLGTVSPASVSLAPGQSVPVTLTTTTPSSPGDEAGSIEIQSPVPGFGSRTTIPVSLRSEIPSGAQSFTQTLTGGNGRAGNSGETFTYELPVADGTPELNAAVQLADNPDNPFTALLIDPSGNAEAVDANGSIEGNGVVANQLGAQLHVLDPAPGAWTLVVDFAPAVSGATTTEPFTVSTSQSAASATVTGGTLPDAAGTTLPAGTPSTFDVSVTNAGQSPAQYFLDPRLASTTTVGLTSLDGATATLPLNTAIPTPEYLVPTDSTDLSAAATSSGTTPFEFDLDYYLGDPVIESSAGSATGPATATESATPLPQGLWSINPETLGAYGATPMPSETVSTRLSVTTLAFDHTISSPTGDLFADGVTGNLASFAPQIAGPGQTISIPVTLTPKGPSGTVVQGTLYVDTYTGVAFDTAGDETSGDQVVAIPYEYTIK